MIHQRNRLLRWVHRRGHSRLHSCHSCGSILNMLQLHLLIECCRYICFRNVVHIEWSRIWTRFETLLLSRYVRGRRPNRALYIATSANFSRRTDDRFILTSLVLSISAPFVVVAVVDDDLVLVTTDLFTFTAVFLRGVQSGCRVEQRIKQ